MNSLHRPSSRWQLGLALSLVTMMLWGGLPIILKILLTTLGPATLTWFRFLVAGVFWLLLLGARRRLPRLTTLGPKALALLGVATLGLAANYYFFQVGLRVAHVGAAQLLIQLSQVALLVGSVVLFKEALSRPQALGLLLIVTGLGAYFWPRWAPNGDTLAALDGSSGFVGLGFVLVAALSWAAYALAQKQLLTHLPSTSIMLVVYLGSALAMTPAVQIEQIGALDGARLWLLVFAAANTVIGYGAFAEALAHWEATRVGAVLAASPIMTLVFTALGHALWPAYVPADDLPTLSYLGAGLVVVGSMLTALARPAQRRV